ncbi:hypothetical protein VOLCADRAFT_88751 [Volvox carteri f. nagariensis]|uniref:Uncharacterized protein n=1 Tax=Volvox carteri f. nagariensis TaxID=3068 RepID=D8TPV2_VOLCA|nr:uncharacterized protein VOLCADRAFT_88751 [Volvox carteri f. nagariensis]EFJ50424.1 hypothetical protein VOLCADRAFT_88751 [Volvox carteri f. nagariensis]|eukprot:XP_002948549.1 hypothetical protein VOLCADRAFT_88751 [Volvox carteri f. nagariensis]
MPQQPRHGNRGTSGNVHSQQSNDQVQALRIRPKAKGKATNRNRFLRCCQTSQATATPHHAVITAAQEQKPSRPWLSSLAARMELGIIQHQSFGRTKATQRFPTLFLWRGSAACRRAPLSFLKVVEERSLDWAKFSVGLYHLNSGSKQGMRWVLRDWSDAAVVA